ncbi:MAG TPA: flagellar basal body P-ring formation chaperone FlgA [Phycisphaerae bacterium]|nr:flagellar basal body P-ring formation protein FlgA [Phycisphaerae bacterium]HOB75278.1 flagellar basal body P-ring formation chaperone FlgA [Phycisphaerae bacterium]HOJ55046.1 flagellar basal body P-ring formation chaperone FlgA [Phycisphaerae bacterium]HOL27787.1 flagellar basal body P-ring formation chaperone FlgA [Phycisphaerae bacterium]HPP21996.1 flagellar basal body P-ring formation chaperone FlgA [Phycisphaerae bacterium]
MDTPFRRCARSGSLRAWWCAAVVCLLLPAPAAWAGAPVARPASETVVCLQSTAVVTGEDVLLSDVAKLEGEAAELAARWPVAAAPRPGSSGTIDILHIQQVLARRGANLSRWIFRGASRCVISKPAGVSPRAKLAPNVRPVSGSSHRVTDLKQSAEPVILPQTSPHADAPDPTRLEGVIYAHLRERLGDVEGVLSVRFSPAVAQLLGLSTGSYQFRITNRGEKKLGMIPLEVTILEKDQVRQVAQVVCQAALTRQVVVASRSINRGEIIQAGDLNVETRSFEKLEDIGVTSTARLIGQRTRRLIKAGDPFDPRDIEPVPLVERNDLVTVSIRRGGLGITATARALSAGSYGDQISLRSELSTDTFVGVVVGPRTVVVSDAARPSGGHETRSSGSVAVATAGDKR